MITRADEFLGKMDRIDEFIIIIKWNDILIMNWDVDFENGVVLIDLFQLDTAFVIDKISRAVTRYWESSILQQSFQIFRPYASYALDIVPLFGKLGFSITLENMLFRIVKQKRIFEALSINE